MKILHLSYYYGNNISGAPVAASRLHNALLRKNVDSYFLCIDQRNKGENVYVVPSSKLIRGLFYVFIRGAWIFTRIFFGRIIMTNLFALPVTRSLNLAPSTTSISHWLTPKFAGFVPCIPSIPV